MNLEWCLMWSKTIYLLEDGSIIRKIGLRPICILLSLDSSKCAVPCTSEQQQCSGLWQFVFMRPQHSSHELFIPCGDGKERASAVATIFDENRTTRRKWPMCTSCELPFTKHLFRFFKQRHLFEFWGRKAHRCEHQVLLESHLAMSKTKVDAWQALPQKK